MMVCVWMPSMTATGYHLKALRTAQEVFNMKTSIKGQGGPKKKA